MDPRSSTSQSPTLASVPSCLAARTSFRSHADGAKIARIWNRLPTLKAQWNTTAPVNSLPNELFVEIFLLAKPCSIGSGRCTTLPYTVSWAPLMLVCRHWRDVILSTPRLWRVVNVGKGLQWMGLGVSRSQNATLDIAFFWNSPVLASLQILLPVTERIAALHFRYMDECQLAAALGLVDATRPHLIELCLTRASCERGGDAPWWRAPLHTVSFDRQRFPNMTTLTIEGVRMVLKDPQAFSSRLRVLDMRRCVVLCDPPIFTLSRFVDVLASYSTLEEVHLTRMLSQFHHNSESQGQPGTATHQSRIVSIPKLRKLILRDEAGVVSSFMSSLYVPLNVYVRIESEVDSLSQDTPALFLPLFPLNRRQTLPILDNLRVLHILFGIPSNTFDVMASSEGAELILSLVVGREHRTELLVSRALGEIIQLYANAPLTDVTVELVVSNLVLEDAEWNRFFAALRAVEDLIVCGVSIDARQVFAALAQSQPDDDGGSVIVCPKLRTLCINGPLWTDDAQDCIVRCLATRARSGATALEKLQLEPCFDMYKEFKGAKRAFLSEIGEVFTGEVEFGYDLIVDASDSEDEDNDDNDNGDDNDGGDDNE